MNTFPNQVLTEQADKKDLNDAYHQKLADNERLAEERTAKKRAKRLKKKQNKKMKKGQTKKEESSSEEEEDEDEEEEKDNKEKKIETEEADTNKNWIVFIGESLSSDQANVDFKVQEQL